MSSLNCIYLHKASVKETLTNSSKQALQLNWVPLHLRTQEWLYSDRFHTPLQCSFPSPSTRSFTTVRHDQAPQLRAVRYPLQQRSAFPNRPQLPDRGERSPSNSIPSCLRCHKRSYLLFSNSVSSLNCNNVFFLSVHSHKNIIRTSWSLNKSSNTLLRLWVCVHYIFDGRLPNMHRSQSCFKTTVLEVEKHSQTLIQRDLGGLFFYSGPHLTSWDIITFLVRLKVFARTPSRCCTTFTSNPNFSKVSFSGYSYVCT